MTNEELRKLPAGTRVVYERRHSGDLEGKIGKVVVDHSLDSPYIRWYDGSQTYVYQHNLQYARVHAEDLMKLAASMPDTAVAGPIETDTDILNWINANADCIEFVRDAKKGTRIAVTFCYESTRCQGTITSRSGIRDAVKRAAAEQKR